jgi:hypothetical protein
MSRQTEQAEQAKRDFRAALQRKLHRPPREDILENLIDDGYSERDNVTWEVDMQAAVERYRYLAQKYPASRSQSEPRQPIRATGARWRILAKLQAKEALGFGGVQQFRDVYLGEEALAEVPDLVWHRRRCPPTTGPLSPDSALFWIESQDKLTPPPKPEWLAHDLDQSVRGYGMAYSVQVGSTGPLFALKRLCERLEWLFHWQEVESVDFVLTGRIPTTAAGYYHISPTVAEPRQHFVVLEVDAYLSPREVQEWYSEARRSVLGQGHSKPPSPKVAALAEFVLDLPDGLTWREKMQRWNAEHPEWRYNPAEGYDIVQNFKRDYYRAVKSLSGCQSAKAKPASQRV